MIPIVVLFLAFGMTLGPAPPAAAIRAVPDDPGALMLPDGPTLQAVVADLDGNRSRDLVRLVLADRGSVVAEVWSHDEATWTRVGGVEVVPALTGGTQGDVVYAGAPVRLIVRADGRAERVTIVRQPPFAPPGSEPLCCLLLHDIEVGDRTVRLRAVGSADEAVDAILALDFDGDGTDELLAMRSLPPLGRTAYPSQALLFRWRADTFRAPITTELPIGSGDIPFMLGDTDGRPGDEAGVITSAAQSILYRLVIEEGDRVRAESAGVVVTSATAVPIGDRAGVAFIGPLTGLAVHPWPAEEELGPAAAQRPITAGRLIGPVGIAEGPVLLVETNEAAGAAAEGYLLPDLLPVHQTALDVSEAAAAVPASSPLRPYRGPLPGGGFDGAPAIVYDGSLLPGAVASPSAISQEPIRVVAFGGAEPLGLAGPNRGWMAVAHGVGRGARLNPAGGGLSTHVSPMGGGVSLVPIAAVTAPELDGGVLDPELVDAVALDEAGTLGISEAGFAAVVRAPPGSRVHAGVGDGSASLGSEVVPADGRLEVRIPLPRVLLPYGGDSASLAVVTPAGATYTASWTVLALTAPPHLTARTETPGGSPAVEIHGRTVPYASVTVDGRAAAVDDSGRFVARVDLPPWPTEVRVIATDPMDNIALATVSGIGFMDYRSLPWVPITVALLAVAAVVLYLRTPRPIVARPAGLDDGAGVEELEPDMER